MNVYYYPHILFLKEYVYTYTYVYVFYLNLYFCLRFVAVVPVCNNEDEIRAQRFLGKWFIDATCLP